MILPIQPVSAIHRVECQWLLYVQRAEPPQGVADDDPDFALVGDDGESAQFRTGLLDGVLDDLPDLWPGRHPNAGEAIYREGHVRTTGPIGGYVPPVMAGLEVGRVLNHFVALDAEGNEVFRSTPLPHLP